jgi:polar amino acid transport system substrate-binding protein/glutamate/aspartate transport system substrate-binding protein
MLHSPQHYQQGICAVARLHVVLLRFCAALAVMSIASAAVAAASTLERIQDRKTIVFGYRDGAPPFSFKDRDGRVRGYSVELCARVAAAIQRQLKLPDLRVEWVPVDADSRIEAVARGRVDAECGTTTITLSRMERVDFSVPIFVDGAALAVRDKSPVQRLVDMKGRRVAVIGGTTTEKALMTALAVADAPATIVHVTRPEEGATAVREGRVDAYAGDRLVVSRLAQASEEAPLTVLPDDFSFEPYAIVVRRDDPDFRLAVNRALVETYKRGDIDPIFQRWLAPYGQPSALTNAMFYLNALPD